MFEISTVSSTKCNQRIDCVVCLCVMRRRCLM